MGDTRKKVSPYSIRRVDGDDEHDTILALHKATSDFPEVEPGGGWYWLAFFEQAPVAYLGIKPSEYYSNAAYFERVGVLTAHRGNGLQFRLMRAMENYARRLGYDFLVSDTTDTVYSANNFIRCGWSLFDPVKPWAYTNSLYWRKEL